MTGGGGAPRGADGCRMTGTVGWRASRAGASSGEEARAWYSWAAYSSRAGSGGGGRRGSSGGGGG